MDPLEIESAADVESISVDNVTRSKKCRCGGKIVSRVEIAERDVVEESSLIEKDVAVDIDAIKGGFLLELSVPCLQIAANESAVEMNFTGEYGLLIDGEWWLIEIIVLPPDDE